MDEVYLMFLSQASNSACFEKECFGYHQNAAISVRENLAIQDDFLTIRTTGRSVKSYFEKHRKLTHMDVEFFTHLQTRVAKEAG